MNEPNLEQFHRPLADTGLMVSPLGLGTVKLGRDQGVKYPEPFVIPDNKSARALLAQARSMGINLLDTAPAYGSSEQRLGDLLKGQRNEWVICSKAGEEYDNGVSHYNFTPDHIQASVERSLRRLNTDYLDIVLIHSDGNDLDIIQRQGALEALADLKRRGIVRAIGMSTKTVEGGIAAADRSDLVMVTLNPDYLEELPVIAHCHRHNKAVFIKKAFASGHLCQTNVHQTTFRQTNPASRCMNFVFATPGVTAVISGTINPDHLRENVSAVRHALERVANAGSASGPG